MRYCNSRRLAVVPQGGNTGLVGGSIPVFDEIVISMQLMNHILTFDKLAGMQSAVDVSIKLYYSLLHCY